MKITGGWRGERKSKLLLSSDITDIDLSNAVSLVTGGCF